MEELQRVESAMEVYKLWGANALRAECKRLKSTPASSNKASYLAALRASILVTEAIVGTGVVQDPFLRSTPDRKTVDCVFRFLNVLFSDSYCDGMLSLGDVATRHALDTHTTGSNSDYWNAVTDAYNDEDYESLNALQHVRVEFSSIDPAAIKPHATITKPNLHECVVQRLPNDIMADSFQSGSCSGMQPTKSTPGKSGSRADGVVEVLKEIAGNKDKTLLTKRQIIFFDESITLKRQKIARSEQEHVATMRAAFIREKKDSVDLLVTLQRNLRKMRRDLADLM